LIVGGTISNGICRTVAVAGRYWISSNAGAQYHRSRRNGQVHPDLERVRLDHLRHPGRHRHVADEVPEPGEEAAATGVDRRLQRRGVEQRVIARRHRVDQIFHQEIDPLPVGPVQVRVRGHRVGRLRGGQVGLHDAAQQWITRPAGIGEPAVPSGRLHLRGARRDPCHLTQQLPPPPGHQTRPGGQCRRQPQPGPARVESAQRTEHRVGQQQIQRRRDGFRASRAGQIVTGHHRRLSAEPEPGAARL
jgi:hypothetical protein